MNCGIARGANKKRFNGVKMGKGDHRSVFGCNNDKRYPEKLFVPMLADFDSTLRLTQKIKVAKIINRKDFKVTDSPKVCSNHFVLGYRCKECPDPTLYMKGYEIKITKKRPAPKERNDVPPRRKRKRNRTI